MNAKIMNKDKIQGECYLCRTEKLRVWEFITGNSFLGLWHTWKEGESESVIIRKGVGLSQNRGQKHTTCWKKRKFSPAATFHLITQFKSDSSLLAGRSIWDVRDAASFISFPTHLSLFPWPLRVFLNLTCKGLSPPSLLSNWFSNILSGITFQKQIWSYHSFP